MGYRYRSALPFGFDFRRSAPGDLRVGENNRRDSLRLEGDVAPGDGLHRGAAFVGHAVVISHSAFKQEQAGMLQRVGYPAQEPGRLGAIDQPVIVGE